MGAEEGIYEIETSVADRIGGPVNAKSGEFDRIVEYWNLDGTERFPCFELEEIASRIVEWVINGQLDVVESLFAEVESLLRESFGTDLYLHMTTGFLATCFFETLDSAIETARRSGREQEASLVEGHLRRIMGEETKLQWRAGSIKPE